LKFVYFSILTSSKWRASCSYFRRRD